MIFFIKADTFQECMEALNATIALLRKLGFSINWKKVVDPFTTITFLGIEIDSVAMCLRLPEDHPDQGRAKSFPRQETCFKKATAIPCREA